MKKIIFILLIAITLSGCAEPRRIRVENFFKINGSYYTTSGKKILNIAELQKYIKAGGKEIVNDKPEENKPEVDTHAEEIFIGEIIMTDMFY